MTARTACVSVAADNELPDVTGATGNARPPTVDSLNSGIRKWFDPPEQSAGRPMNCGSVVSLHAGLCMSEQPCYTVSVLGRATSGD